jgi:NADH-ubiquinone oxidoreductase chain 5
MAAPTPVSSLVHSSTLVTAGVYLFIRFYFLFEGDFFSKFFRLLFLLTSFSAGLFACCEVDLKKLVAISTLSQLGIMMACLRVSFISYSFFHLVSHALFKSLLFLRCGIIILLGAGLQDIRSKGGKAYFRLVVLLILIVSNLSLCGVPFLSGFFSRDLIIETFLTLGWGTWVLHVFIVSCVFSIVYSFKMIRFGLFNKSLNLASLIGGLYSIKIAFISILCF